MAASGAAYCGVIHLSAAPDRAPPTTQGMPTSTWPMALATTQPRASAVWPTMPHHWVLREEAGPYALSCSIAAIASLRTRANSNVSAASTTSCSTTRVSLLSWLSEDLSVSSSSLSREALVARDSLAMLPMVRRSTLFWSLAQASTEMMRMMGSREPVAK